jgi:hypothetical protein
MPRVLGVLGALDTTVQENDISVQLVHLTVNAPVSTKLRHYLKRNNGVDWLVVVVVLVAGYFVCMSLLWDRTTAPASARPRFTNRSTSTPTVNSATRVRRRHHHRRAAFVLACSRPLTRGLEPCRLTCAD